jgi:hypothetical protein
MARITATCFSCGKELGGGTDTFGDVGENMCWECYSDNGYCSRPRDGDIRGSISSGVVYAVTPAQMRQSYVLYSGG